MQEHNQEEILITILLLEPRNTEEDFWKNLKVSLFLLIGVLQILQKLVLLKANNLNQDQLKWLVNQNHQEFQKSCNNQELLVSNMNPLPFLQFLNLISRALNKHQKLFQFQEAIQILMVIIMAIIIIVVIIMAIIMVIIIITIIMEMVIQIMMMIWYQ